MDKKDYHSKLKVLMDDYVTRVYDVSESFPKNEMYGLTSQLRRASLSVILNCIEGYARQREKSQKYFMEISYGSLKESKYLVYFSCKREYMSVKDFREIIKISDEIGAMLWGIMRSL